MSALVRPTQLGRSLLLTAAVAGSLLLAGTGVAATREASHIHGLTAQQLSVLLARRGFVCTGPRQAAQKLFWLCQRTRGATEADIQFWGDDPTRITLVEATVIRFDGDLASRASELFDVVAGLSLSGNRLAIAQSWLRENVHDDAVLEQRGVSLRLFGRPGARILRIEPR